MGVAAICLRAAFEGHDPLAEFDEEPGEIDRQDVGWTLVAEHFALIRSYLTKK